MHPKEYKRQYYLKNKDKWLKSYAENRDKKIAQSRSWRLQNTARSNALKKKSYYKDLEKSRERCRRNQKALRDKDPEAANLRMLEWRLKNPERSREAYRKANHKRYNANPRYFIERNRQWALKNPEKRREQNREHKHRRRVLELSATTSPFSRCQWLSKVQTFGGRCAYCDSGMYEHMDHVVPLSRGGAHALDNVVPSCKSCNLKKGVQIWTPRTPCATIAQ